MSAVMAKGKLTCDKIAKSLFNVELLTILICFDCFIAIDGDFCFLFKLGVGCARKRTL